jgi:[acyl-carrier-protein] S-malonyltransferase
VAADATAFVFPGQGSQRQGMGAEWRELSPRARALFERADAALGIPLTRLCLEGPESELVRTENAQPALYLLGVVAATLLRERGLVPSMVAGHSLGEFPALHLAGVFSFEDGLRLVRRRGELMAGAGERVPGGMAAILGLPTEAVTEICAAARPVGVVEVANYNAPGQTVISGAEEPLVQAMGLARERGARRVVRLNVSAPFHSSLMAPLRAEFEALLAEVPMSLPTLPVIANVFARPVPDIYHVCRALTEQLAGSVRWTETVEYMARSGASTVVECGPGRVLTALTPRIVSSLRALDTAEALELAASAPPTG